VELVTFHSTCLHIVPSIQTIPIIAIRSRPPSDRLLVLKRYQQTQQGSKQPCDAEEQSDRQLAVAHSEECEGLK
jgi:hypothetical protein